MQLNAACGGPNAHITGEHCQPPYEAINPNRVVPVLDDGDFRLTESSAILKYLAGKAGSLRGPFEMV